MRFRAIIKNKRIPYFTFLLPLFFVVHGLSEYLFYIPVIKTFELFVFYTVVNILLIAFFYIGFKDTTKAAFTAFISFAFFCFFGAIHDGLKNLFPDFFLTRYSFFIPLLLVIYILLLYAATKRNGFIKLIKYFNLTLIVLILFDLSIIGYKIITNKNDDSRFPVCGECSKPDVYLIVLDGYAGNRQLISDFSYHNKHFFDGLGELGFYLIPESKSNYQGTVFSISSLLNFEYLNLKDFSVTDKNLNYCYRKISQNKAVKFFQQHGYEFYNNSIFDIGNAASRSQKTFLISGVDLISSQTLWSRVKKDLYYNFLMNYLGNSSQYKDFVYNDLENNLLLYNKTKADANIRSNKPKFIYTHLMMPHFPYYFNETGQLNQLADLRYDQLKRKDLYLGYLKYCNRQVLSLVHHIKKATQGKAIIMLLSDHGYRYASNAENYYSNLAAIYRPDGVYGSYYDSISNVNQFRVLFNQYFHQNFEILPDRAADK